MYQYTVLYNPKNCTIKKQDHRRIQTHSTRTVFFYLIEPWLNYDNAKILRAFQEGTYTVIIGQIKQVTQLWQLLLLLLARENNPPELDGRRAPEFAWEAGG